MALQSERYFPAKIFSPDGQSVFCRKLGGLMTLSKIFIQLVVALVCAGIANVLIPREIPGKTLGLLIIGLAGVLLGEWVVDFLKQTYNLHLAFLEWEFREVPIIPAIIGSTLVLYVFTGVFSWGRYRR
jgi:uncharacterized membrane protein YeaQ/YmgE (transglycosylase-associated protein family)